MRELVVDDIESDDDSISEGYTVHPEDLGEALQKNLNPDFVIDPDIHTSAIAATRGDMGQVDAELADVLVQVACFNEIRYG